MSKSTNPASRGFASFSSQSDDLIDLSLVNRIHQVPVGMRIPFGEFEPGIVQFVTVLGNPHPCYESVCLIKDLPATNVKKTMFLKCQFYATFVPVFLFERFMQLKSKVRTM